MRKSLSFVSCVLAVGLVVVATTSSAIITTQADNTQAVFAGSAAYANYCASDNAVTANVPFEDPSVNPAIVVQRDFNVLVAVAREFPWTDTAADQHVLQVAEVNHTFNGAIDDGAKREADRNFSGVHGFGGLRI